MKSRKNILDKDGFISAMFVDLSRSFDTMNRDLLTDKLEAYSCQEDELSLIKRYLTKRRERVHVYSKLSTWGNFWRSARFSTRSNALKHLK